MPRKVAARRAQRGMTIIGGVRTLRRASRRQRDVVGFTKKANQLNSNSPASLRYRGGRPGRDSVRKRLQRVAGRLHRVAWRKSSGHGAAPGGYLRRVQQVIQVFGNGWPAKTARP